MKLKSNYSWRIPKEISISAAVESEVVDDDRDGIAERAHSSASRAATFLGNLVEMLHGKGVLTDADVLQLVGPGYEVAEE